MKFNFRTGILLLLSLFTATTVFAAEPTKTIIDEWSSISAPPAPALKQITVNSKTSALLILDIQTRMADPVLRPRCAESIPKIKELLSRAREKKMPVVYSLTSAAVPADIVADVAPLSADPIVKSSVDKFYNTDLDSILKKKGIQTVVIVGTAAHGAVLHTATASAQRGYQVVIPVDGMSSDTAYAEQYTAWHMLNSPGTRNKSTLTKTEWLTVK